MRRRKVESVDVGERLEAMPSCELVHIFEDEDVAHFRQVSPLMHYGFVPDDADSDEQIAKGFAQRSAR